MIARQPRPIDHCVLPVDSLDVAAERLTALGFTVAPIARHPFGTANRCVYFKDSSYLEPLAIVDSKMAAETALKRNVFAVRDAAYRFRVGSEGFSALAFGTQNARADHRRFVFSGLSAGRQLTFSRPFSLPDGSEAEAAFRLAFAADPRSPDAFFFTCERTKLPEVDRTDLQTHANGTVGISRVIMSEPYPVDFGYLCQELARARQVTTSEFGISVSAKNGAIDVYDRAGCKAALGISIGGERGLRMRAIVFAVSSLSRLRNRFEKHAVRFETRLDRIVVSPEPGQGAIFAFEETGNG